MKSKMVHIEGLIVPVGVDRHFSLLNTFSLVTPLALVELHGHSLECTGTITVTGVGSTPTTETWSSPFPPVVVGDKTRAPKQLTSVGLSRV